MAILCNMSGFFDCVRGVAAGHRVRVWLDQTGGSDFRVAVCESLPDLERGREFLGRVFRSFDEAERWYQECVDSAIDASVVRRVG